VLFHEGVCIIACRDGIVEGYRADTGEFLWKLGLPEKKFLPPQPLPEGLLIASRDGTLMLVETETGKIRQELSAPVSLIMAPLVAESVFYLASSEGEVLAYEPDSNQVRWKSETQEPVSALSLGGNLLTVSGATGTLTAIETTRGNVVWTFRGRGAFRAPAVFDAEFKRLFVGDGAGTFYALSADKGKVRYRWETGASIMDPVLLEDDLVYVASYANTLFAYRAGKGHELWRINLPGRPASGPFRVNQRLVVITQNGFVVEIDPVRGRRSRAPFKTPDNIRPPASVYPPYTAMILFSRRVHLMETAPPEIPEMPQEETPEGLEGEETEVKKPIPKKPQ
jgi:outer membrane protein assembly factor BamB